MNAPVRYFDASPQAALGFVVSQTSHIEPGVFARRYPDITYMDNVPLDFSANQWAKSVTYYSSDKRGSAKWFTGKARDFPFVDTEMAKFDTPVHMAAVGYKYDLEEINQARMLGIALDSDRAAAARRAYEEMCEGVAYTGDAAHGWKGLLNYTGITTVASANGAGGSPLWANKTADEITQDVNNLLTGIFTASLTIEMADTLLLPIATLALLGSRRIDNTTMTVLDYIRANNIFTQTTGRPLTIKALRQLDTAGAGGTKRVIAYSKSPDVLKMHIPMPLQFLTPEMELLEVVVPGIFRLGGVDIRRPGAVRYFDGF